MFAKAISVIYERHSATLITMAKGAHEIRNLLKQDVNSFADHDDLQTRLDDFYMSRIGIRMVLFFFGLLTFVFFFLNSHIMDFPFPLIAYWAVFGITRRITSA